MYHKVAFCLSLLFAASLVDAFCKNQVTRCVRQFQIDVRSGLKEDSTLQDRRDMDCYSKTRAVNCLLDIKHSCENFLEMDAHIRFILNFNVGTVWNQVLDICPSMDMDEERAKIEEKMADSEYDLVRRAVTIPLSPPGDCFKHVSELAFLTLQEVIEAGGSYCEAFPADVATFMQHWQEECPNDPAFVSTFGWAMQTHNLTDVNDILNSATEVGICKVL